MLTLIYLVTGAAEVLKKGMISNRKEIYDFVSIRDLLVSVFMLELKFISKLTFQCISPYLSFNKLNTYLL